MTVPHHQLDIRQHQVRCEHSLGVVDHSGMFRAEFSQDDIPRFGDKGDDGGKDKVEDPVRQRVGMNEVLGAGDEEDEQRGHRTDPRIVAKGAGGQIRSATTSSCQISPIHRLTAFERSCHRNG